MSARTKLGLPAVLLATLVAVPVLASDPPHWYSESLVIGCTEQCHTLHNASGGNLTSAASNVNVCQSCHNATGLADQAPISGSDVAVPGVRGSSHAFDVPALHPTYSTQLPQQTAMNLRIMNDNVSRPMSFMNSFSPW